MLNHVGFDFVSWVRLRDMGAQPLEDVDSLMDQDVISNCPVQLDAGEEVIPLHLTIAVGCQPGPVIQLGHLRPFSPVSLREEGQDVELEVRDVQVVAPVSGMVDWLSVHVGRPSVFPKQVLLSRYVLSFSLLSI